MTVPGWSSAQGPNAAHSRPTFAIRVPEQGNGSWRATQDGARHRPCVSGTWSRAICSARYHISRSAPSGGCVGGCAGSYGRTDRRAALDRSASMPSGWVTVPVPSGGGLPGSATAPDRRPATPGSVRSTTPHVAARQPPAAGYRPPRRNQHGAGPGTPKTAGAASGVATIGPSGGPSFRWTTSRQAEPILSAHPDATSTPPQTAVEPREPPHSVRDTQASHSTPSAAHTRRRALTDFQPRPSHERQAEIDPVPP